MMIFVDTETTGLHTRVCALLEVGIVVVDWDLDEIESHQVQIKPDDRGQTLGMMDDVVLEMHTKNGLIRDVWGGGKSVFDFYHKAEANLLTFLQRHLPGDVDPVMCGSTIGFDRAVLKERMPTLEHRFHYRSIDVSSVKELVKLWAPDLRFHDPVTDKAHRAVEDCRASIRELRHYREVLFANDRIARNIDLDLRGAPTPRDLGRVDL